MPRFSGSGGVDWIGRPGGGVKRIRPHRKTPGHLVRQYFGDSVSATCLELTEGSGSLLVSFIRMPRQGVHQDDGPCVLVQNRTGVGWGHLGHAQAHVSRLRMTLN